MMNLVVSAEFSVPTAFRIEMMVYVMKAVVADKAAKEAADEA